jgi:hypothetical protein
MNRELKFRLWDKTEKCWENPSFENMEVCRDDNNKKVGTLICLWSYKNQERWVIQQYTGFNDLRGQEIYEGDIFKSQGNRKWDSVEFKNGQWQANLQGARVFSLYEMFGDDIGTGDYPEVIGNIFENE